MQEQEERTENEYFVALFDVLGFESQFKSLQLADMLKKYEELISIVNLKNEEHKKYKEGKFHGAFWLKMEDEDGVQPIVIHEIGGTYASDSIIVWANRRLLGVPIRVDTEQDEITLQSPNVFADSFLEVCSEIMCHAVEIGLPLRGGISTGNAVLEQNNSIYLGQPIIDAARIERKHNFIGTSFHANYDGQSKQRRYAIEYGKHLKEDSGHLLSGMVIDWPRHWRETRSTSAIDAVNKLNVDKNFSHYYENTVEFIRHSNNNQEQLIASDPNIIFPGIHAKQLGLPVRLGKNG